MKLDIDRKFNILITLWLLDKIVMAALLILLRSIGVDLLCLVNVGYVGFLGSSPGSELKRKKAILPTRCPFSVSIRLTSSLK